MLPRYRLLLFVIAFSLSALAQDRAAGLQTAFARAQHLRHGINASEWFAQSADDHSAARTSRYTDDGDIALMAKLGFDNVRLSIDPVPLEEAPQNNEGFNADFLGRLDHAVDTMLSKGLAVQIDIHPEPAYKQHVRETSDGVDHFVMMWRRLAKHYSTRNPDLVFFEIMNEPEVSDSYRWSGIQARAAATVREVAPKNTLIATGPNWSGIGDLLTQQPLPDGNVIYTSISTSRRISLIRAQAGARTGTFTRTTSAGPRQRTPCVPRCCRCRICATATVSSTIGSITGMRTASVS